MWTYSHVFFDESLYIGSELCTYALNTKCGSVKWCLGLHTRLNRTETPHKPCSTTLRNTSNLAPFVHSDLYTYQMDGSQTELSKLVAHHPADTHLEMARNLPPYQMAPNVGARHGELRHHDDMTIRQARQGSGRKSRNREATRHAGITSGPIRFHVRCFVRSPPRPRTSLGRSRTYSRYVYRRETG